MRVMIPFLRPLTWMRIYLRKALLAHRPMTMIVSGYTLARNISIENPDRREWVPTSLCENTSLSFPKYSVPDLRDLVFIWDVISVLWWSTQTVFTGVSCVDTGYESCLIMIYAQMSIGQRFVLVYHCVTMAFLTPFLCVRNVGDNLSDR